MKWKRADCGLAEKKVVNSKPSKTNGNKIVYVSAEELEKKNCSSFGVYNGSISKKKSTISRTIIRVILNLT